MYLLVWGFFSPTWKGVWVFTVSTETALNLH